jgi:quercetin dioxygenase-like cupin family protein
MTKASSAPASQLTIKHVDDKPWESAERFGFPPGPEARVYAEAAANGGLMMLLGRFPEGFVEPEHVHEEVDHWCVILEGEMHVAGQVLRRGDYLFAPRGVAHGPLHYPVGATVATTVRGAGFDHEFASGSAFSEG